jgi:hypothetical protein
MMKRHRSYAIFRESEYLDLVIDRYRDKLVVAGYSKTDVSYSSSKFNINLIKRRDIDTVKDYQPVLPLAFHRYDRTFMIPSCDSLNIGYFIFTALHGGDVVAWNIEAHYVV